jgi:hypothetical protein
MPINPDDDEPSNRERRQRALHEYRKEQELDEISSIDLFYKKMEEFHYIDYAQRRKNAPIPRNL